METISSNTQIATAVIIAIASLALVIYALAYDRMLRHSK
jgi:hypothetical protein